MIYGDTLRSLSFVMRFRSAIGDPFIYAEVGGVRHVVVGSLEVPRLGGLDFELHPTEEYGADELRRSGTPAEEMQDELMVRVVHGLGITAAVVPASFPLLLADRLRADGVELTTDRELFNVRRRVKSSEELAGIRRAQGAAEAGMTAARELLRRARRNGTASLEVDGTPLTSERIKLAIAQAFIDNGATRRRVRGLAWRAVGDRAPHGARERSGRASRS